MTLSQSFNGPKKNPSPVSVRLTAEERAQLEQAAAGTSLSSHIRECLFGAEASTRKRRQSVASADARYLAQVLGLLGQSRIANNLNQLAKRANAGVLEWDDQSRQQVAEANRHIAEMRAALIQALGLREGR